MNLTMSSLVAYCLGLLTPFLLGRVGAHLGFRQKDLDDRINELCDEIQAQADRACAYWSGPNPRRQSRGPLAQVGKLSNEEAKIVGADFYIGTMLKHITEEFGQFDTHLADGADDHFFDAVTGGDFQVVGRKPDFARIQVIQRAGYDLCVALRKGRRATIFPPRVTWR